MTTSLLRTNATVTSAWALVVLPMCFLLSGFAGIVYQIAWARQFALIFGTTEVAVTLVLAAYMAGLGLGAWLVQRFLLLIDHPVRVYAALELVIGASAVVLVPAVIAGSDWLLRTVAGHQPELPDSNQLTGISIVYGGCAFVALAVPTTCMGATLPLLTRHIVQSDRQTGRRVGLLFAANTLGAVAGALAATGWILPAVGLTRTIGSAAILNVIAGALALTVSETTSRSGFAAAWAAASRASFSSPPAPTWILPLMLLSGAVALFHEVLWTRWLSQVLGGSLQAFGVMLAGALGGLALGAAVGSAFARDRRTSIVAFVVAEVGCAVAAAAAYNFIGPHPASGLGAIPIAFFSGATFPLAVRILAKRAEDAASAAARVYAWNTLGAILGALSGGFVLIPALQFEGSIQLAVWSSALLAIGAIWLLVRAPRLLAISVSVLLMGAVTFEPAPPTDMLRASPLNIEPRVIDANLATRGLRKHEPLADGRVRVVINDARSALNLTQHRYDAIVSQPSHPWTAAASHLYTREFMTQAREHLTDDGVFVQWLNVSFMDESLLRSFAATVLDVFAEARLYRPDPYTLIFVAGKGLQRYQAPPGNAFPAVGINTPEDILVALAAKGQDLHRLSRGAPIITDDRNRMATVSAQAGSLTLEATDRLLAPFDPLRLPNPEFQRSYMARRLAMQGARERLGVMASATDPQSQMGYEPGTSYVPWMICWARPPGAIRGSSMQSCCRCNGVAKLQELSASAPTRRSN